MEARKQKVYLACPWFTNQEAHIMKEVAKELREYYDYEVYVPREHEIEDAWDYSNAVWGRKVFEEDIKAIKESDLVYVVDFGLISDSGTSFELGFAFGLGINIVHLLCPTATNGNVYALMGTSASNVCYDLYSWLEHKYTTPNYEVK